MLVFSYSKVSKISNLKGLNGIGLDPSKYEDYIENMYNDFYSNELYFNCER